MNALNSVRLVCLACLACMGLMFRGQVIASAQQASGARIEVVESVENQAA